MGPNAQAQADFVSQRILDHSAGYISGTVAFGPVESGTHEKSQIEYRRYNVKNTDMDMNDYIRSKWIS